ncbi:MAG: acyltransferase [Pirellulales bacterium]|nr:acyltransferase [Pirellulales bacterium]
MKNDSDNTKRTDAQPVLDLCRFLGAAAIVWLHTVRSPELLPSTAIGRFAVPFFTLATVFFVFEGIRHRPDRTWGQYARGRLARIGLPFVAWTLVGLAYQACLAWGLGRPVEWKGVRLLWEGSTYNLWFLSFLLAVNLAVFPLGMATHDRPRMRGAVAMAAALLGIAIASVPGAMVLSIENDYWRFVVCALSSVFWGVGLALFWSWPASRVLERNASTALGGLLFLAATIGLWRVGGRMPLLESLAGLGVMIVALRPGLGKTPASWRKLGALAFGIYLAHPLFMSVYDGLAKRLPVDRLAWQYDVGLFVLVLGSSVLLAWLLHRYRWTRWLAP